MSSNEATIPVVVGTIIICALKLALYLIDKYNPPLGTEITTIVDQISNLHAKVDAIVSAPLPAPVKSSTSIPITVLPL